MAEPERLASQLQILMSAAIVQAAAGLVDAARLAREVAVTLLAEAAVPPRRGGRPFAAEGL